jgi:hypothetical protein
MDRETAQRTIRVGLIYMGIAIGLFGLTFVLALLYTRS